MLTSTPPGKKIGMRRGQTSSTKYSPTWEETSAKEVKKQESRISVTLPLQGHRPAQTGLEVPLFPHGKRRICRTVSDFKSRTNTVLMEMEKAYIRRTMWHRTIESGLCLPMLIDRDGDTQLWIFIVENASVLINHFEANEQSNVKEKKGKIEFSRTGFEPVT
ncbi:hypothetical protein PoB_003978500 [Plakobranchus ocellatus]|uniref:Uncharacterized protein n=1 Tax=Plakobranchus ocellatus TaxID=259542 RepID=A0AAV4B126_9GAST|nr:hypothetical protein PoB_003978500 [Plakobranchus ocellatus]